MQLCTLCGIKIFSNAKMKHLPCLLNNLMIKSQLEEQLNLQAR